MAGVKGRSGGRRAGSGAPAKYTLQEKIELGLRLTPKQEAEAVEAGLIAAPRKRSSYRRRNSFKVTSVSTPTPTPTTKQKQKQQRAQDCMEDRAYFFSPEHDVWACPFCIKGLGE